MTTTRKALKKISSDTGMTPDTIGRALNLFGVDTTTQHLAISTRDAGRLAKQARTQGRLGHEEMSVVEERSRKVMDLEEALAGAKRDRNRAINEACAAGASVSAVMEVSGLSRSWVDRIRNGEGF